ncbi:glycosyltransferase [[Empedobacter] haloabium]|uniref:Glycosyltransferase n=1 Tax=[Empedobacter] haloabium TaxID=592317 RepID=A0ABZ1UQI6_9BURK
MDDDIRILQLVPEPLPTFRADVAVLFGKYLPRQGVHCAIVGKAGTGSLDGTGFVSAERPAPGGRRWAREFAFFRLCLRKLWGTSRRDVDLIQVRDMVTVGLAGLVAARLKGLPFVYWMSFPMSEGRILRARAELAARPSLHYRLVLLKGLVEKKLLYSVVMRCADHVFVQSTEMQAMVAQEGIARDKLTPVPMGVDTEAIKPETIAARRLPGWEGVPVVAYLGTLDRARQLDTVMDAVVLLRQEHPAARLLLIGDSATPADIVKLREHAAAIGLPEDAYTITGWLPGAEAMALLAGADAAISYFPRGPLLDSASPTKLLEYMALGIPAIGNDNPDQVALLTSSQAGLLTDSTPAAFAQAMAAILTDRATARARAAAGPDWIENQRSYRVLSAAVAQRYRSILQQFRPNPSPGKHPA